MVLQASTPLAEMHAMHGGKTIIAVWIRLPTSLTTRHEHSMRPRDDSIDNKVVKICILLRPFVTISGICWRDPMTFMHTDGSMITIARQYYSHHAFSLSADIIHGYESMFFCRLSQGTCAFQRSNKMCTLS